MFRACYDFVIPDLDRFVLSCSIIISLTIMSAMVRRWPSSIVSSPRRDYIGTSGSTIGMQFFIDLVSAQTPELGITVETSSVVRQALDNSNATTSPRTIGWMRTMIELDKATEAHLWAIDCQGEAKPAASHPRHN